jgi:2-haloacid dehalogenase
MIEFLFLDLDDTVLDFGATERRSITRLLENVGVTPTEEIIQRYRDINLEHWKRMERGEITRNQISNRFDVLFGELGVAVSTPECETLYRKYLSEGNEVLPGADEALERLHQKYRIFAATNSTVAVQTGRLKHTGLGGYFEKLFISEALGVYKPNAEFFHLAFSQIPDFEPDKAIMVGDSLTSDIQGGINAGIRTCWINPRHRAIGERAHPDYEIESIVQLPELLEKL